MKKRNGTSQLNAWRKSERWRSISRSQARKNLAAFRLAPRCGAHCRSTGEPCRNPVVKDAMRCRLHGGRTPSGKNWHIQQPVADAAKAERRIADRVSAATKRAKRLSKMTTEERQRYDAWHRARKPGATAARQRARAEREANAETRKLVSTPRSTQQCAETAELDAMIAMLKAELARRQQSETDPLGAFA